MFRSMRRKKQQLSEDECIQVLESEPRGVLSLIGDEGYPYSIPINHYYDRTSNKLYFHGAKVGHKIDAMKNNDKVCFCTYDKGYRKENEWALNIKSVILFGRISLVDDFNKTYEICEKLCYKFSQDKKYVDEEFEKYADAVQCFEIEVEHISGKLVNES